MTLATGWGCWNQRKGPNALLAPMVWPFARLSFPWVALFSEISDCLPSCPFIAVLGCWLLFSEISNIGKDAASTTGTGCPPCPPGSASVAPTTAWDSDRALKQGKMLKLTTYVQFAFLLRCQWCETPCSDQQSQYLLIRSRKQYSWSLLSWVFG